MKNIDIIRIRNNTGLLQGTLIKSDYFKSPDDRIYFQQKLRAWWKNNHRDFPWRTTRNTYHILIAEILLHRTRAEQIIPVYNEFLEKYPTIREVADASESEIREILYSLGLHWRARLLHYMAVQIVKEYECKIPLEKEKLESLPGVSQYIASAVRCFALGFPEVLLDTNTVRITGRIFGIKTTDSSRRSVTFRELLQFLVDEKNPREFNFALIDLCALICRSSRPSCSQCPVIKICTYGNNGGVI
ncbi:MAG: A/G-specific adenine glycosylase [Theionarchaea archaeon]|nr:A/G-specific adenine glycosylase [Theionarchaea archaeon]